MCLCPFDEYSIPSIFDQEEDDNDNVTETAVIGFWSGVAWLAGLTALIAILSQFVVDTIEVTKFNP